MLDEEFLELLRRKLNLLEEDRLDPFSKKHGAMIADQYERGMYHSSVALFSLVELVTNELQERTSTMGNTIFELYSNLGKGHTPSLNEDIKQVAGQRFDSWSRHSEEFLKRESKKIFDDENLNRGAAQKFKSEAERVRNKLIFDIDLYVESLKRRTPQNEHWFKGRMAFIRSSIKYPAAVVLGFYALLGAVTWIRDEFLPVEWQEKQLISFLPHWSIQAWLLLGLVIFTIGFIEGAYRVARKTPPE